MKPEAFTVMENKDHVQMVPVGRLITKGMNSTADFFKKKFILFLFNQEDENLAFKKMIAVI